MPRPRNGSRPPYHPEDIVDIAVRVFLQCGYDGTSMGDLAQAAGITKSSLYHHVSGKEELFERGVGRALDALFGALDEPGSLQGAAIDRIRYLIRRTVEIVIERQAEVALLVRTRGNTEAEKRALDRRREFNRTVTRLAMQAIRDGDLSGDIDPSLFTRLALGMAASVVEWYQAGGKIRPAALVAAVEALIFGAPAGGARTPDQPNVR